MRKPKPILKVQRQAPWPVIRMFGLGLVAILAVLWAMLRPKRPWQFVHPAPYQSAHSGEIEVDLWDGGP